MSATKTYLSELLALTLDVSCLKRIADETRTNDIHNFKKVVYNPKGKINVLTDENLISKQKQKQNNLFLQY